MLPTKFRSIQPSCFRVEDFQKSTNQKQELPVVAMFLNGLGQNVQSLYQRTFHRCLLPSFGSFGQAVSEEKIFQKSTCQKQELSVAAMFVHGLGLNEQSLQRTLHRSVLPGICSFEQAVSEEKIFQKLTNQKQELPVAAMFVNGSGLNVKLSRGPSIDASYQVSVHLAKWFQRRRFLEIGQSETRIACGGHVC